jgi:hypothetical protein
MDIFVWVIDITWEVFSSMFAGVMNLKLFEYGEGESYLIIRVYHFFFVDLGFTVLFFVLRAYFKRGAE